MREFWEAFGIGLAIFLIAIGIGSCQRLVSNSPLVVIYEDRGGVPGDRHELMKK